MTPLLHRDLVEQFRRPRTYFLLAASALLAGAAVGTEWPAGGVLPFESNLATRLFARLAQAHYILLLLATPALAGAAIVAERERGTLPLLTATLVAPGQIVASRIAAIFCLIGLLAGVTLPFLALPLLLGTARPAWLVTHIWTTGCLALYLAAAGVFVSARSRRARNAIPLAYLLGWAGACLFAALGLFDQEYAFENAGAMLLGRIRPGARQMAPAPVAAILALAAGLLVARLAARALARPPSPAPNRHKRRTGMREPSVMIEADAAAASDGRRARSGRAVGHCMNPVLSAELRTRLRGRLLAIAYGAGFFAQTFLLLLTLRLDWFVDADSWVMALFGIHLAGTWLCCAALAAMALPLERERNTLPLLLASPLFARQIVVGKWLGALWYGLVSLVCVLPFLATAALTGTLEWAAAARLAMICAGTVALAAGAGLGVACSARGSAQAIARVLGLTAVLCLVGLLVARVPEGSSPALRGAREAVALLDPWQLAARAVDRAGPAFRWWDGARPRAPRPQAASELPFLAFAACVNLAALALTIGVTSRNRK